MIEASNAPWAVGRRRPTTRRLAGAAAVFAVAVGLAVTRSPSSGRAAVAACVAMATMVLCLRFTRACLVGLLVWLPMLGTLRRVFAGVGATSNFDPLLLVGPIVVAALVLIVARGGAFRNRTPLSNGVLVLSGLVGASTVNPLQGGLAVGAAALLFVLVPLLWFWLGRGLLSDVLFKRSLWVTAFAGVSAAGYGLYQVYRGFPTWDARWIEAKGYTALAVGESTRPFASFSNASEYVTFVAIGAVIWVLRARQRRTTLLAGLAIILIAWALAVASVRSITVILLVTLALVFAMSYGFSVVKSAVVGLGALVLFSVGISMLDPAAVGGTRTASLLNRQVTGLSDPFNSDERVSTLPLHLRLIGDGLLSAFRNPVGRGFGSVTIAGNRLGGETLSTEADPSNVAVALGLPGVLAYTFVVFVGLRLAFRRARQEKSFLALAALGVLLVTSLQWLTGGNYATALFPWLILGWLDRPPPPQPRTAVATATLRRAGHPSPRRSPYGRATAQSSSPVLIDERSSG